MLILHYDMLLYVTLLYTMFFALHWVLLRFFWYCTKIFSIVLRFLMLLYIKLCDFTIYCFVKYDISIFWIVLIRFLKLHCTILHGIALFFYAILFFDMLNYGVFLIYIVLLCYIVLYCALYLLYCIVLYCIVLHCIFSC